MRLHSLLPAARRRAAAAGPARVVLVLVGAFAVLCWCGGLVVVSAFGVIGDSSAQEADLVACQAALGQGAVGRSEATAGGGLQGDPAALAALDDEQRGNGALIVEVGVDLAVPPRAWVIAVATATQESGLRNLPHLGADNDHDSLGLFQQRPSQGWGTAEQILDPVYATTAFYERLRQVEGWEQLPLTVAAQAVQRSAFPDAYARHEPLAVAVVNSVAGDGVAGAAAFESDLRCAGLDEVTAAGWTRPAPGPVWSGFRTASRPTHYGIDIGAPRGTEIRAAADGVVTRVTCNATLNGAAYSCDVDGSPAVAGCGWYVNIRHGEVVTRYCHQLTRPEVAVGDQVAAGQRIGLVGSSGRSSGPHLHFEVEIHTIEGTRTVTDPVRFMAARGVEFECPGSAADCQPAHGDHILG